MRPKILFSETRGLSADVLTNIEAIGDVCSAHLDREGLLRAVHDVDILWVGLRHYIDAEVMNAAPHLTCIVSATTGLNHIDTEEAARRGIRVLSLRGESDFLRDVRATAEHTIALMLALLRRLPAAAAHAAQGGWDRDLFLGSELYGKLVGVIGYGRLGKIVTQYLGAFGAHVVVVDPFVSERAMEDAPPRLPLHDALAKADMVTLHVALTPETKKLIGHEQFAMLRRGAWLINTSRGEVIDENALLDALVSGRLGGAALDVLDGEQWLTSDEHPLRRYARQHDNLILTPHIGGYTSESRRKTDQFMVERLRELITNEAAVVTV